MSPTDGKTPNPSSDHLPLERLVAAAPAILYQFRLAPDGSFSIPFISPRIESFAGIPASTLEEEASTALGLIHPEDLPTFNEAVRESAERVEPFHLEFRGVRDGDVRWVESQEAKDRLKMSMALLGIEFFSE